MNQSAAADGVQEQVGNFLSVLARAIDARRILEIGMGAGWTGLCLARALPAAGVLFAIEIDPDRAQAARASFARAGVADRANVIVGDPMRFVAKVSGPFDLIFHGGDLPEHGRMLDKLLPLLRQGGVLVTSGAGGVSEHLAADERLVTSVLPLPGGLTLSVRVR